MQHLGSAVLDVLLGEYIENLDQRQLELDVLNGHLLLQNLSIKPSALQTRSASMMMDDELEVDETSTINARINTKWHTSLQTRHMQEWFKKAYGKGGYRFGYNRTLSINVPQATVNLDLV